MSAKIHRGDKNEGFKMKPKPTELEVEDMD
jgi:hypothetical protein